MENNEFIENIEKQLNKLFGSLSSFAKVSFVLSNLDLSDISKTIEHKHPTFSADSLLKLYLYKRVKGITTYPNVIRSIRRQENRFNLTEFPNKRTFNEFIQKKADKLLLDKITESILKIATQSRVVLDIELVKETIKKTIKNNDRHKTELREATKLIKRLIYPQIDLKIHHNAKFTTKDLLDVLVYVCQQNDFCNNGSVTFEEVNPERKVPNGDTLMYHFNKLESTKEVKEVFERIFDVIFNFAKKEYYILRKRKVSLAIDIHNIPYYGNKGDNYVREGKPEKGTTHFFSFLTCSIVVAGKRFTIDAVPIHPLDILSDLVDKMVKRAKRKIHIDKIYLDRGFESVKIINVLKKNNIKFLMPKIKRKGKVMEWFDKSEDCRARVIKNFEIKDQSKDKAIADLVLVDDEDGIKRAFYTNIRISEPIAHYMFRFYSKRWGIETGYRNMDKDFRPRTTSKNYIIRLFYFLFSVCLYNLWVLVNLCVSIAVYGKLPDKPIITAKRFAIVLYRVYVDSGG